VPDHSSLITRDFLDRPAERVAPELLGYVLEHETADGLVVLRLTEVEAYAGEADPASHAYRGKTPRNAVMYGPPGHAYVYFTYGMHFCVNVVCRPAGTAAAVLLRAGEVIAGEELARCRRTAGNGRSKVVVGASPAAERARRPVPARDLARGPARLCQALGIDRALDGADLCDPAGPLRLRSAGRGVSAGPGGSAGSGVSAGPGVSLAQPSGVQSGPRVGVSGGAETPWRFWLQADPTVSAYRPNVPRNRV
jgi:DNA-3-methyladenine glycosylase